MEDWGSKLKGFALWMVELFGLVVLLYSMGFWFDLAIETGGIEYWNKELELTTPPTTPHNAYKYWWMHNVHKAPSNEEPPSLATTTLGSETKSTERTTATIPTNPETTEMLASSTNLMPTSPAPNESNETQQRYTPEEIKTIKEELKRYREANPPKSKRQEIWDLYIEPHLITENEIALEKMRKLLKEVKSEEAAKAAKKDEESRSLWEPTTMASTLSPKPEPETGLGHVLLAGDALAHVDYNRPSDKLLIVGGVLRNGEAVLETEVIDAINDDREVCQNYPSLNNTVLSGAGGVMFNNTPVICGGVVDGEVSRACFIVNETDMVEINSLHTERVGHQAVVVNNGASLFFISGMEDPTGTEFFAPGRPSMLGPPMPNNRTVYGCFVRVNESLAIQYGGHTPPHFDRGEHVPVDYIGQHLFYHTLFYDIHLGRWTIVKYDSADFEQTMSWEDRVAYLTRIDRLDILGHAHHTCGITTDQATGEQLMIAVGGNINYRSDTSQAPPRVFNLARLTTFKFDALKLAHGTGLPWIRMPIRKDLDPVMVPAPDGRSLYHITSVHYLNYTSIYKVACRDESCYWHELKSKLSWNRNFFAAFAIPSPPTGSCSLTPEDCNEKMHFHIDQGKSFYKNCQEEMQKLSFIGSGYGEAIDNLNCRCNFHVIEHCGSLCFRCPSVSDHNIYIAVARRRYQSEVPSVNYTQVDIAGSNETVWAEEIFWRLLFPMMKQKSEDFMSTDITETFFSQLDEEKKRGNNMCPAVWEYLNDLIQARRAQEEKDQMEQGLSYSELEISSQVDDPLQAFYEANPAASFLNGIVVPKRKFKLAADLNLRRRPLGKRRYPLK